MLLGYFNSFFLRYLSLFWLCWVLVAARRLSLVVASGVYCLVVVHGLLIVVTSFLEENGL